MKSLGFLGASVYCAIVAVLSSVAWGESKPVERLFSQSPTVVEKAVHELQSSTRGRLPTLDGFAVSGDSSLDLFQRGYYQCDVRVNANPSGGSIVRVTAKITAWYSGPDPAKSGYRVLTSNGRLEADFLDRLADSLQAKASVSTPAVSPPAPLKGKHSNEPEPTISAPMPQGTDAIAGFSVGPTASPSRPATPRGSQNQELSQEAKGLEEILRNQSHPTNLVAVKEAGTPVLVSPNVGAKVLFRASAEDEFEILDMNSNWVHVRISGLSRGWIRRSSLEMPESSEADTATPPPGQTAARPGESPFQIENEQIASFPADWEPLRGKTVKIVSLQEHGAATETGAQAKLAFARSLLNKEYDELHQSSSTAAGVVLIFDAADGGMMATTMEVLQQWKTGTLSDEALWRRCYFDPPELSGAAQP